MSCWYVLADPTIITQGLSATDPHQRADTGSVPSAQGHLFWQDDYGNQNVATTFSITRHLLSKLLNARGELSNNIMETPTPVHKLTTRASQVSPEIEGRGGFAQENSGCWMLKAMERDRGWFWRLFTVSLWLLVSFLAPRFLLQHIL